MTLLHRLVIYDRGFRILGVNGAGYIMFSFCDPRNATDQSGPIQAASRPIGSHTGSPGPAGPGPLHRRRLCRGLSSMVGGLVSGLIQAVGTGLIQAASRPIGSHTGSCMGLIQAYRGLIQAVVRVLYRQR